ncbi:unnamed protein product [Phytophthora fragariaefolia]|uniref:Unnamed protein product n=1 Tax=Phytophthora fragariaefolia TaxID=1490495 RepID=A0A9W7CTG6_9STRA|nr:unnamed protein product [Phytophthora fragariaefolia]
MPGRCRRMPETEKLCRQVVDYVTFLHDAVAPLPAADPTKRKYSDVVVRTVKLQRRKALLQRLAGSETIVTTIRELQLQLSDVAQALGLADTPEAQRWQQQWDADRAEQFDKLNQLVTGASERMLVNELRGDKKVQEALMGLNSGMRWKDQPAEMLELKQTTFARISSYLNQTGLRMFDWFIPIDDIEYEKEAIGNSGTFGNVCRGMWTHEGRRIDVAIKLLFPESSNESDDAFLRQLELWEGLQPSKYILKLHGGSHVSNPKFYVCENAQYNLAEFLEDENRSGMFWRLFRQVAEGLKFLHSKNIVHGSLKCNNILVTDDFTAKLADFGFTTVRTLSAGLSQKATQANEGSVRWKAKEVLVETGSEVAKYESDIYSLAMCMIEAKTHEVPFGMDDDKTAMNMIVNGESHPRPDDLSDAEWDFISRLSNPDYKKRPTLDEVMAEIGVFAETEEQQHPRASIA